MLEALFNCKECRSGNGNERLPLRADSPENNLTQGFKEDRMLVKNMPDACKGTLPVQLLSIGIDVQKQ